MNRFTQYAVSDSDDFDPELYPEISREIDALQETLREIKSARKTMIIISLLRDHSVRSEWLDGNKQLTSMLTSGSLPTSHLESLFSSSKQNKKFAAGLEAYITKKLG